MDMLTPNFPVRGKENCDISNRRRTNERAQIDKAIAVLPRLVFAFLPPPSRSADVEREQTIRSTLRPPSGTAIPSILRPDPLPRTSRPRPSREVPLRSRYPDLHRPPPLLFWLKRER